MAVSPAAVLILALAVASSAASDDLVQQEYQERRILQSQWHFTETSMYSRWSQ